MILSFPDMILLFTAGVVGGAVNAVAGGGTFFTFPAMLAVGLPPVVANASNAVAIWPGHAMEILAYRAELAGHGRALLGKTATAIAGGLAGAGLLLLLTGDRAFSALIPLLLLAAKPDWKRGHGFSNRADVAAAMLTLLSVIILIRSRSIVLI